MINLSLHNPTRMKAENEGKTFSSLAMSGFASDGETAEVVHIFMPYPVAKAIAAAFTAAMAAHLAQSEPAADAAISDGVV